MSEHDPAERRDLWWDSPTVDLAQVMKLDLETPFVADHGGELAEIQVAWESWGELNADRSNAILLIHPMTADCHATGAWAGQPRGWWEDLIGPGRALDTDRWCVLCPNLIGGCYGTTGPRDPAPDGEPWHDRFPLLTPRDMMRVQRSFLDALGIDRCQMVIGPSMGGMIAWEWAIESPQRAGSVVVVAAPLRTTPHQIGLNWLQRRGIELDFEGVEVIARQGQMVARGVGMLSYRSPTGLEEKFGREWFKPPGATLKERGMFNIESWLRQHGRRILKKFDPYTYLLFSRAMDLHDVSDGRNDLISALDRVTCPVLVIGISSDYLYPPEGVHHGVDLLDHLGRDVYYGEIRSPHGHDAFLIDTDQISDILGAHPIGEDWAAAETARARVEGELRPVRIGILGAGRVATSFVQLVRERGEAIAAEHGLELALRGVAEIDTEKEIAPELRDLLLSRNPESFLRGTDLDVVVALTRGTDVHDLVELALRKRRHVVTPNKALLRAHGEALDQLAEEHHVRLAYHDSIAAGWPLLHAMGRPAVSRRVVGIRGVLSSSVNFILERMATGEALADAVTEAQRQGLTEPDPALDLSGWDTAQKLILLHTRTGGRRYSSRSLERVGIEDLTPELVGAAAAQGMRIKLVALVVDRGQVARATVRPMAVPTESHLGAVRGGNHVVVFEDSEAGEAVFLGAGAGHLPVAMAVLNDVIGLFDLEHSWTGRFPVTQETYAPPIFDDWVTLEEGRLHRVRSADAPPHAVPYLDPRAFMDAPPDPGNFSGWFSSQFSASAWREA